VWDREDRLDGEEYRDGVDDLESELEDDGSVMLEVSKHRSPSFSFWSLRKSS
jgi:hypothetical protein